MASPRADQLACLCLVLLLGAACGGADKRDNLTTGDAARRAYEDALVDYQSGDCVEAEPLLREVRRQYPFTRFAALAELKLADCLFEEDKYIEAISGYRQFIRQRPSHVEVPYAQLMIAKASYEQIPSDWLLAPPSHERDQASTESTLNELQTFLRLYPQDPRVAEAKQLLQHARDLLARRELYVADFYRGREHPEAAVGRLRNLLSAYAGSSLEPQALYMLGEVYADMKQTDASQKAFRELVTRFPKSEEAESARSSL